MRASIPRGTYALMLRSTRAGTVVVGSLGSMNVEPGLYLYLGSAFGPGGLEARLSRHAAQSKVKHWHIDYLRPRTSLVEAWFSTALVQLEHEWAARVLALPNAGVPLPRFGASDCGCASHLVRFPDSEASSRSVEQALAGDSDPFGRLEAAALRSFARATSAPRQAG